MKNTFIIILILNLFISCQSNTDKSNTSTIGDKLIISYMGDADRVTFKMFQGLQVDFLKDSITGYFEGTLDIPNINEAIFTYDINILQRDSSKQLIELEPKRTLLKLNNYDVITSNEQFLWIGENRNNDYLKNENLSGTLETKSIQSDFLAEERSITVYTPPSVDSTTPHIYLTDGNVVNYYAPYIDLLITTKKIKPIILIGIHSSVSNRHKEYVEGGDDNEVFKKHENFVYNEVLNTFGNKTENWEGKKYLFGFSNGAAFCMHAGLNHPTVFEEIIVFSTADYISSFAQMRNPITFELNEYPKFYMGAGKYETSIFKGNINFAQTMIDNELDIEFKTFISGHDYNVWRIEFLEYLEKRFPY